MQCTTCPRLLTQREQGEGCTRCEVCRGLRADSKPKAIIVSPPKKAKEPQVAGESWWTQRSRAELKAESEKRFTR